MLSDSLQEVLKRAFAEEAKRLLLNFEEELEALNNAENGAQRREHFGNLRRTAHTLKGASRSVEFAEVESLSLVLEKKFKALATESDEPFLNQSSLDILSNAVEFLGRTVNSLLEDSDSVVSSQELMDLMTQVEELTLESAPESTGPKLPDSERDRIRFLIKMLKKTTSGEPMGSAFKKAFQILLSLNKIAQDNELKNVTPLTEALEQKFRTLSTGKTPSEWPPFEIALELLGQFGKKPATFRSDLLDDALSELSEDSEVEKKTEQISDAFLTETNTHLEELRSLISDANVAGKFDKKRLKVCLMSLTGATRVVDLPAAETICRSLNFALTKYAEADLAPPGLLTKASEAVELLAQETKAFSEGTPGMASWKAMHIVERLDSAVDEIETLKKEAAAKSAAAAEVKEKTPPAPVPTPEPVSAQPDPPPAKEASPPKADAATSPPPVATDSGNKDWAKEALAATAPLEGLISFVARQTSALERARKGLAVWSEDTEQLEQLFQQLPDGEMKAKAESYLQKQKQRLNSFSALLQREEFSESDSKNLLRQSQQVRDNIASTFLTDQSVLESHLATQMGKKKLTFKGEDFEWDERYWTDSKLGSFVGSITELLSSQTSKPKKLEVTASCSEKSGFSLQFRYPDAKLDSIPEGIPQLKHQAKSLFGKLSFPETAGADLTATLELPRFLPSPRAVFFSAGNTRFCVSTTSVWGVERLTESVDGKESLSFQGLDFTVHRLAPGSEEKVAVCVEKSDGARWALIADQVFSEEPLNLVASSETENKNDEPQALYQGGKTATLIDLSSLPTVEIEKAEDPSADTLIVLAQSFAAGRSVLARAFRRAGHTVKDVGEGHNALEALEKASNKKKVLIADFHLPDMHGETLCETAKNDPALNGLTCVVLAEPSVPHSESQAVDEYLDKAEFDLSKILELVS